MKTPDQYRREGAEAMREAAADHCWSKRDLLADAEKRQIDVGLSGRDYYGRRLEAELLSRTIRAIDVDAALAGLRPRCAECDCEDGNCTWIKAGPDAVARLVETAKEFGSWISASMSDPYSPPCGAYLKAAEKFLDAVEPFYGDAAMEADDDLR